MSANTRQWIQIGENGELTYLQILNKTLSSSWLFGLKNWKISRLVLVDEQMASSLIEKALVEKLH